MILVLPHFVAVGVEKFLRRVGQPEHGLISAGGAWRRQAVRVDQACIA